ncbi:MAG: helix-turn-helix domain-containing protein [Solobacterium sp.]|nr:helix-turn-helix domain-containing protein [Solobacterium sp.]
MVANSDTKNVTTSLENVTANSKNVTTNLENVTYQDENVTYEPKNVTSYDNLSKNEMEVLMILMEQERLSREEIAERMLKTVRTVQRSLNSLREKGYIQRIGAKRFYTWEVVKNVRNNK